jgi:2'-5' RNA ligase
MGVRRLFCALMVGPELGAELARATSAALGLLGEARARGFAAVPPADLHVTLAFAGELEPAAAERLQAALARELSGAPAPRLTIAVTDAFPRRGWERVLVARVLEPEDEHLAELAARAARAATGEGIELPDAGRPFAPHVTLARVHEGRRGRRPEVPERFYQLDFGLGWQPSAAAWVESPGGGAPYRVLAQIPLIPSGP